MSTISIDNFPFDKIKLLHPKGLQGGTYCSKIVINDDEPILIQTPKCLTKSGIHKTQKDIYCDLKFSINSNAFLNWIENLEETIRDLIFEKRNHWFHNEMDLDMIEYHWQNVLRLYKKNNKLLRCYIKKPKYFNSVDLIQIYDEEENKLSLDDFNNIFKNKNNNSNIICILEISELKFTSQSFIIEFNLRQAMVLKNKPIFNKCLINISTPNEVQNKTNKLEIKFNNTDTNITEEIHTDESDNDTDNDNNDDNNNDKLVDKETSNQANKETSNQASKEKDENNIKENTEQNTEQKSTQKDISNPDDETNKNNELVSQVNDNVQLEIVETTTVKDLSSSDINNAENKDNNLDKTDIDKQEIKENVDNEITTLGKTLEKVPELSEITLDVSDDTQHIKIKPANEVYLEIYKQARVRAKNARKAAVKAYLEAKRIKRTYLLDDIESSEDDLEEYAELFDE